MNAYFAFLKDDESMACLLFPFPNLSIVFSFYISVLRQVVFVASLLHSFRRDSEIWRSFYEREGKKSRSQVNVDMALLCLLASKLGICIHSDTSILDFCLESTCLEIEKTRH